MFYLKFKKQVSYLYYNNKTLINNLKKKIFIKLKKALSITVTRFNIVFKLKNYLQTINNNQQNLLSNQTYIKRIRAAKIASCIRFISAFIFSLNFFNRVFLKSIFTLTFLLTLVITQLFINSRSFKVTIEEKWFTCKKSEYIIVDCS